MSPDKVRVNCLAFTFKTLEEAEEFIKEKRVDDTDVFGVHIVVKQREKYGSLVKKD